MTPKAEPTDGLVLERRAYGPDSTEQEQRAIRNLVTVHSDGVIVYREPPVVTKFTLDLFWERIRELSEGLDRFYLIADLTDTRPPNQEVRRYLRDLYATIHPEYVAIFTGKNFVLNVAAKFVLGMALGKIPHSVHKDIEGALGAIDAVRAR